MSSRPTGNPSCAVVRLLGLVLSLVTLVIGLSGGPAAARKHRPASGTVAPTTAGRFGGVPTLPRIAPTTSHPRSTTPKTMVPTAKVDPRLRRIGFRTSQKLQDHYAKHGHEFGGITIDQYLSMAQDLRDAPLSKTVVEAHQVGGTISRFDRRSGAFIAFDTDLTIRTFFKPNDGEAYFRRAAQTTH